MTASPLSYEYPPFDRIRDEHYAPALEAGMAEQLREVRAIADAEERATFDNTLIALERSGVLLNRAWRVFANVIGSHTNDALQQVQAQMAPRLAAHRDAIFLDAALFARIDALHQQREALALDPESDYLLERYHREFVRAGVRLPEADKERLKRLNAELSALATTFLQNLQRDNNASAVIVDDVRQLDGLSSGAIAAAAEAARARGLEGRWLISLQLPTVQPALSSLTNRDLRERLYRASISRGSNGNEFDNRAALQRIAVLRAERAHLLGYPDHATYVLEEANARTRTAVDSMLAELAGPALVNARAEAAELQSLIDAQQGGFELAPWDWAFYAEQLRKQRFDINEAQIKPYFEMERVLQDGVFFMAQQLYGLSFRERPDLPVYHPDVRVFEVFDADQTPLGLFLVDYFERPSKRGGAWMNSFVVQNHLHGTKAVVANNLNIPKPPPGEPVLLSFDEVNIAFHEFGHAVHGLFSQVRYPFFSGTAVPRDFVEFPSQVHEMWMTDETVLRNYARHYQTGAPMPAALVERILAAEQFNQGFMTTEYLAASLLDQAWHQIGPDAQIDDVLAFEATALKSAGVALDAVLPRYRSAYFQHVFAGGYAAGYYSYIWSEVLDADAVVWFRENGGLRRENGDHFRQSLLSRGGSREASALYRDFRGRDPDIAPLLKRRGLGG